METQRETHDARSQENNVFLCGSTVSLGYNVKFIVCWGRKRHTWKSNGREKSGIASAPSPALCLRSSLTCFNATHFFHFYKPLLLTVLLFSHTAKCHACQRQRCRGQRKPSDSPTHSIFFSHLKFLLLSRLQRRIRKNYLHRGSCNAVMCNG